MYRVAGPSDAGHGLVGDTVDVDRDKARRQTTLTLTKDNEDPLVLSILGHATTFSGDLDIGSLLIEKCLAIDPNCLMGWQRRGWLTVYRGGGGALADFDRALALNPRGPESFNTMLGISQAQLLSVIAAMVAIWALAYQAARARRPVPVAEQTPVEVAPPDVTATPTTRPSG